MKVSQHERHNLHHAPAGKSSKPLLCYTNVINHAKDTWLHPNVLRIILYQEKASPSLFDHGCRCHSLQAHRVQEHEYRCSCLPANFVLDLAHSVASLASMFQEERRRSRGIRFGGSLNLESQRPVGIFPASAGLVRRGHADAWEAIRVYRSVRCGYAIKGSGERSAHEPLPG